MGEAEQNMEFTGVGRDLRAAREAIGKQIKDAALALRIGAYHLEALEAGRYDDLPEPVYVHGFVRSYAGYLKLDPDEMVRRVRQELLPPIIPEELHFPAAPQDAPRPSPKLLLLALILAVGVIAIWYLSMGPDVTAPPETSSAAPQIQADPVSAPTTKAAAEPALAPAMAEAEGIPPLPPSSIPEDAADTASRTETTAPQIPPVDELVAQDAAALPANVQAVPQAPATSGEDGAILAEQVGATETSGQTARLAETAPAPPITLPPSPPLVAAAPAAPALPSEAAVTPPPAAEMAAQSQQLQDQALIRAPVVLRASGDTWLQITYSNGAVLKSWVMRAGEQYVPPADQAGLKALVGNAGALTVFVDGVEMPPLGKKGEVVRSVPLDVPGLKSRFGG